MRYASFAVAITAVVLSPAAWAQGDARHAELLRQRERIDAELQTLERPAPTTTPTTIDIIVTGRALSLTTVVTGQTVTNIDEAAFRNTPATTIADIVKLSPGVAVT